MKKYSKLILSIITILILLLFIRPDKVYYEAKISGKIIDENGNPIANAIVYRIEEISLNNKEIGSIESIETRTDSVFTDKKGNFILKEKSEIDWFHTPLDLPIAFCFGNFEVRKEGFISYKTEFDEFRQTHIKNCYACENIEFKPLIILKKHNKNSLIKKNYHPTSKPTFSFCFA
ncbi:MAG: hypothetical protein KA313_05070 [Pseudarcicella sp.]|nr:hypothetical protein [Pseudarcicella sp.]MBP6410449.1 hypothetical protein [Pseudarcicella sp.]